GELGAGWERKLIEHLGFDERHVISAQPRGLWREGAGLSRISISQESLALDGGRRSESLHRSGLDLADIHTNDLAHRASRIRGRLREGLEGNQKKALPKVQLIDRLAYEGRRCGTHNDS